MANSTHKAEVVRVKLESHPNADSLSIARIFGYCAVVRTDEWSNMDVGVYIPPDSMVPNRPIFAFLFDERFHPKLYNQQDDGSFVKAKDGMWARVTVKKIRGIISQGLLLPIGHEHAIGSDLASLLGLRRYEPPLSTPQTGGEAIKGPSDILVTKYDIETIHRYASVFQEGESVSLSEKVHGACGAWLYYDGKMWCRSRKEWKRPDDNILWYRALKNHPEVEDFCKKHSPTMVFGEVYGDVQSLKYGLPKGQVRIGVFDLYDPRDGKWIDVDEARGMGEALPWVPIVAHNVPFCLDKMLELAEGPSLIPGANHIREGVVVKPMYERWCDEIGRVQLKLVSNKYLQKDF